MYLENVESGSDHNITDVLVNGNDQVAIVADGRAIFCMSPMSALELIQAIKDALTVYNKELSRLLNED